jgi:hypothetical protein
MLGRLALMLTISPDGLDRRSGIVRLANIDSGQPVTMQRASFVLTLEREPDASFARGHLRSTTDGADYPIQTTTRLFDALQAYVQWS